MVAGVNVQHVAPCRPGPLGWHGDEPEDEGLDAAGRLQPEPPDADPPHDGLVEVAYQGGEDEEGGVPRHGRLWEPAPSEAVAHVVEDSLLAAAQVVELHDVRRRRPEVVGEYAAVGVLTLPEVGLSVDAPLPLDDEAVGLALPFLHKDGVDFVPDAVDLRLLPSPQREDAGVERFAAAGTDVEVRAVLLDFGHYLLGTRPAVGAEAPDADASGLEPGEDAAQGVLLPESHVGVAVAVLDADGQVADDGHGRPVAGEVLVGRLCVVFLRLQELVVEVEVVSPAGLQPSRGKQGVDQQAVEPFGGVESIALPRLGRVADVLFRQLPNRPEDGVGAACAERGVEREVGHEVARDDLDACAAAEVDAHQRADDLAVTVSVGPAPEAERTVYRLRKHGVKLLHHGKNPAERRNPVGFNLYLCHVCQSFACFVFNH